MEENFFIKLLQTGNIRLEDGLIIIWSAHNFILPVRALLKLQQTLCKKYGMKTSEQILRGFGSYQVEDGLRHYSKLFDINKKSKEKIIDFCLKICELVGIGRFNIVSLNEQTSEVVITSRNIPFPSEYKILYGKSKQPIDFYICGIWEQFFSMFFAKKMQCVETKCIACGDEFCQFEIYPVKKSK